MQLGKRVGTTFLVALLITMLVPTSAQACGCGAFVSESTLQAVQETALVTVDGTSQSLTMNLATQTADQVQEVAFVMPVPARAKFTLADSKLFTELDQFSKPTVKVVDVIKDLEILGLGDWGSGDGTAAGSTPGGVTVLDQITLGPYDVVQLTGEVGTVVDWLGENGFTASPGLEEGLAGYLDQGWYVVAAKLTATDQGGFSGELPPMRVSFSSTTVVYPMKLSAMATNRQQLRLYVLADHRMDASGPAPSLAEPDLTFAGWVEPGELGTYPVLADQTSTRKYLTRYDQSFDPTAVTTDVLLTQAANDVSYRSVITNYRYVNSIWTVLLTIVFWVGLVAVGAWAIRWVLRRTFSR